MEDCIFCKIVKKEIPAEIVKETDNFLIFKDIEPSAPIHLLIVPKVHYDDIKTVPDNLWQEVKTIILDLENTNKSEGFRIVNNAGVAALVRHFHVHLMGGITKPAKQV